MKTTKHTALVGAAVAATLLVGWLGASMYVGHSVQDKLSALVQASSQSKTYRLSKLQHESGLFSSSGQVEITLIDGCDEKAKPSDQPSAQISYKLSNLIMPTSLLRGDWTLAPTDKAKPDFEKVFGGQPTLTGRGRVLLSGAFESDMNLPALNVVSSGETLTVSPSTGTIAVGKDTLDLDWKTTKITHRGSGSALEIEGFSVTSSLTSIKRGLGTLSLGMDKFGTSIASADGLRLSFKAVEGNGRYDMFITPSMKSLNAGGKQFSDLLLEMAVKGMDAQSIAFLIDLSDRSCNFRNLTLDESKQMQANLRQLLFKGMSAGIQKLTGKVDGGSLDGQLMVEFGETKGSTFELEKILRSQGELKLTGSGVKPDDKKTLVSMGIAQEVPDGVRASFDYASGVLKVNGKVFDATLMETVLKSANAGINQFLTGSGRRVVETKLPEAMDVEPPEADGDAPAKQPNSDDT